MNKFAMLASFVSLGLVTFPSMLYFAGSMDMEAMKWTTFVGTVCWFVAASVWMKRERQPSN